MRGSLRASARKISARGSKLDYVSLGATVR